MHAATQAFMDMAATSRALTDDSAEARAEALLDEIEEILIDAMGLRRQYRRLERMEEADELRGRLHGYESKLRALDRDGNALVVALETFRMTLAHLKRADARLTQWVAGWEESKPAEEPIEEPAPAPEGVPNA